MLLDSGFSPDDVAHMRRQFYEGRGEEVPDDVNTGDLSESSFFFSFFLPFQYQSLRWKKYMS